MSKGTKIPRKTVDVLVAMAIVAAMERLENGEADEEDVELLRDSVDYLQYRRASQKEDHR